MKHFGDITKLNGDELPVVDIITGGSPCQDLSVAGVRAGLAGSRSGLFREQIRIIKEMREHDRQSGRTGEDVRCRWSIWENVPGCFSSNGGYDFQAVLTEFVRIAEPDAPDVPMPPKNKWPHAGLLYDELGKWSVAWREHDSQFWGVPQRRKRVSVVADFGGLRAGEILFECESVQGDFNEGGASGQDAAAGTGSCSKNAVDLYNGSITGHTAVTFGANSGMSANHAGPCVMEASSDCKVGLSKVVPPPQDRVIASMVETYMNIGIDVAPVIKSRDYKDPMMILRCVS